jgi:hypothetical protein
MKIPKYKVATTVAEVALKDLRETPPEHVLAALLGSLFFLMLVGCNACPLHS